MPHFVMWHLLLLSTVGGANKALLEQFQTTASTSGTITIQFSSVTDQAQVNGIEVGS